MNRADILSEHSWADPRSGPALLQCVCTAISMWNRRTATIVMGLIDAAVWAFVAVAAFYSGSDAATKGLDQGAGLAVTVLFLVTGAPALGLAWAGGRP